MLLTSLFVVPLSYDIANGDGSVFNWFAICFFGLSYPISIFILIDPRVHVHINKDEIASQAAGAIPWDMIKRCTKSDGRYAAIYLHLPYEPHEEDEYDEGEDVEEPRTDVRAIYCSELNVDHAALYALIQQLIATGSAGREEILKAYPRGRLKRRLLPRLTRRK